MCRKLIFFDSLDRKMEGDIKGKAIVSEKFPSKENYYLIPPEHLVQYTGLKSKQEQEIYDRHVLINETNCYVVEWNNLNGRWSYRDVETKQLTRLVDYWECEIIGHILSNPELLEGE